MRPEVIGPIRQRIRDRLSKQIHLLRPAVILAGKTYTGFLRETHNDVLERHRLEPGSEKRGFASYDKSFMDRAEALEWVKDHQPKVFARMRLVKGELHAKEYSEAVRARQGEHQPSTDPLSRLAQKIEKRSDQHGIARE